MPKSSTSSSTTIQVEYIMRKEEILAGLEKAVVAGKKQEAIQYANDAIAAGVKALDAIDHGLIKGMNIVGDKYGAHEFYLPQVLLDADTMYGALDVLLPHIPKADADKRIGHSSDSIAGAGRNMNGDGHSLAKPGIDVVDDDPEPVDKVGP